MKSHKDVAHRRSASETVFELKKTALRLRRQGRAVKELVDATGLKQAQQEGAEIFWRDETAVCHVVKRRC